MDSTAIGEPGIDYLRRVIDSTPDLREHLVDDPPEVRLVPEADVRLEQLPLALDPDLEGAVDHNLGDAVVEEQLLERTVADDVAGQVRHDLVSLGARET